MTWLDYCLVELYRQTSMAVNRVIALPTHTLLVMQRIDWLKFPVG